MKKLVLIGMIILAMAGFSEKLNTDGKDHLNEILGEWGHPNPFKFYIKDGKLWHLDIFNYGYYDDTVPERVTLLNNYTYMIHSYYSEQTLKMNPQLKGEKICFAYDTKYKKLAFLKKCGSDEVQQYIPRKYPNDGKLRG